MPSQPYKPKSSFSGKPTVYGLDNKSIQKANAQGGQSSFTPGMASAGRANRFQGAPPVQPGFGVRPAMPRFGGRGPQTPHSGAMPAGAGIQVPGQVSKMPGTWQPRLRGAGVDHRWQAGQLGVAPIGTTEQAIYGDQLNTGGGMGQGAPPPSGGQQQGGQQGSGYYDEVEAMLNEGAPGMSQQEQAEQIAQAQLKYEQQMAMQNRQLRENMASRGRAGGYGLGAGQEFMAAGDITYSTELGKAEIANNFKLKQQQMELESYWKEVMARAQLGDSEARNELGFLAAEIEKGKLALAESDAKMTALSGGMYAEHEDDYSSQDLTSPFVTNWMNQFGY